MNRYDQMVNKYLVKNKARSAFTITGVVIVTAFLFVCLQITLNYLDLIDAWSKDSMGANRFGIYFLALLIYINTVIVVGIIKQSIMISSLDQIKNYGILRLLGATRKQIAFLIFKATFFLECVGAMIGFVIGYIIYLFLRKVLIFEEMQLSSKFRWEAAVYVLLVLLFDTYFSVRENVKLINQMTPLEAYRGTFRIQKEKRTKHIPFLFKAFGIEGQYAYKNVRRNPGRFFRSVCALTFGMAVMIGIVGSVAIIKNCLHTESNKYGYYGVHAFGLPFSNGDNSTYREIFKNVTLSDGRIEGHPNGKPLYGSIISMTDPLFIADSVKNPELFQADTWQMRMLVQLKKKFKEIVEIDDEKGFEDLTDVERNGIYTQKFLAEAALCGFDEEDFKREETMLIDGTTSLSDQGILFVAGFNQYGESEEYYGFTTSDNVIVSDHKVGDQVTFYDPQSLYERYLELKEKYATADEGNQRFRDNWLVEKAKKELLKEGKVKTYTIEGILARDANYDCGLGFVLPLDRYFSLVGQGKEDFNGVMFHPTADIKNINNMVDLYDYLKCDEVYFMDGTLMATSDYDPVIGFLLKASYYGIGYALIIYILTCINIFNTSITNIHLRRSEFAQLKVLGTSQGGLRKIVLLEGFIISLFSTVGSIIIGLLLEWFLNENILSLMMPTRFSIPYGAIITCFFINLFFMCVCSYMPLKKNKVDLVEYLYENEN